jgi:hypothetical protein
MPKTISAAQHVRRSGRPEDDRRKASDLLQAVAVVECNFAVGGPAGVPGGLLRDVVSITADLADRAWLEAHAESAACFTASYVTQLPALAELDQILADVLSSRFGVPSATAAA